MEMLKKRVARAVDGLLENESLTADLDDAAAQELLNWGIAWVEQVVGSTAALSDEQAEVTVHSQLRAVRRLMRGVNKWVSRRGELDADRNVRMLAKIIEQVAIIRGVDFEPPNIEQQRSLDSLYQRFQDDPRGMVAELRGLVDESPVWRFFGGRLDRTGEIDDKE